MNPENSQYRQDLADKLASVPKENRKEQLDEAKQGTDYWKARQEFLEKPGDEETVDDGMGVFVKQKRVFHGSNVSDIQTMEPAIDNTIGHGLYTTSGAKEAIGYARARSRSNEEPVVYEMEIKDIKLLDLTKDENVQKIAQGFRSVLNTLRRGERLYTRRRAIEMMIENVDSGRIDSQNVREMAFNVPRPFSEYVKSLGYDGIKAMEGGESDIGDHDTYLIFDPEKARKIQEHKVV